MRVGLLALAGIVGLGIALATPAPAAQVDAELAAALRGEPAADGWPIIATMREQVDLGRFARSRETAPAMIRELQQVARQSQAEVLAMLSSRGAAGGVRSLWIVNAIALRATVEIVAVLAERPEVARIELDPRVVRPEVTVEPDEARATYWNLNKIRAPEVWQQYGLDGTGIVVGVMDTGADISHPALAGKWRGGANSWTDIINGLSTPYDDHGHGTHVTGTIVGGDGPGPFAEDIGVAYNARFIAAKVLDANNSFSGAAIVIAGAEWMLDPDGNPSTPDFPHVINNSWYFFNQTYTGFHYVVEAWRTAGIIPVFCLGNEGPNAATTRPPGNYGNLLGIGATNSADNIWSSSSRGPSPSGWAFPADLRKPDLSAPGAAVRSSLPGGAYASWSGTSMATPHVVGAVALMLQANPGLAYGDIRDVLFATSVDLGVCRATPQSVAKATASLTHLSS